MEHERAVPWTQTMDPMDTLGGPRSLLPASLPTPLPHSPASLPACILPCLPISLHTSLFPAAVNTDDVLLGGHHSRPHTARGGGSCGRDDPLPTLCMALHGGLHQHQHQHLPLPLPLLLPPCLYFCLPALLLPPCLYFCLPAFTSASLPLSAYLPTPCLTTVCLLFTR